MLPSDTLSRCGTALSNCATSLTRAGASRHFTPWSEPDLATILNVLSLLGLAEGEPTRHLKSLAALTGSALSLRTTSLVGGSTANEDAT